MLPFRTVRRVNSHLAGSEIDLLGVPAFRERAVAGVWFPRTEIVFLFTLMALIR